MTPMKQQKLYYKALLRSDDSEEVTSLIAYRVTLDRPLQAVLWSIRRREWIYAPAVAAQFLFDDMRIDQTRQVSRTTAEQLASDVLQTTLPSEETLQEMNEEGARKGWRFGPPLE
jgi:hypothetical protein